MSTIDNNLNPTKLCFSQEQNEIIKSSTTNNIIINAVAGSGKTTTIVGIVQANFNKKILILTYNTRLMEDTKVKINKHLMDNNAEFIEIRTFHSFAASYWASSCRNDDELNIIISQYSQNIKNIDFDLIIIDEAQDLTPILWNLCQLIFANNIKNKSCRYILLGDVNQTIYQHNRATPYYFINADTLINNNIEWKKMSLTNSFRVKQNIWEFLKTNDLNPNNGSNFSTQNSTFNIYVWQNEFIQKISDLIEEKIKIYGEQNIFVISPFINNTLIENSLVMVANEISKRGYGTYYPISNLTEINDKILKNKVVFASVHQSKGRERKCVIVYNFNSNVEKNFNINEDNQISKNLYYVALTRASEDLTLVNFYSKYNQNFFPSFIDTNFILKQDFFYTDLNKYDLVTSQTTKHQDFERIYTLQNFINTLTPTQRFEISQFIKKIWLQYPVQPLELKNNITLKSKKQIYDVVSINNVYVKLLYFFKNCKNINNLARILHINEKKHFNALIEQIQEIMNLNNNQKFISLAMVFDSCFRADFIAPNSIDIKYRNWISSKQSQTIYQRLSNIQDNNSLLRFKVEFENISTIIDLIDYQNEIVYALKFNETLNDNDIFEMALIGILINLNKLNEFQNFRLIIFNIYNNSKLEVELENINELCKLFKNYLKDLTKPKLDINYQKSIVDLSKQNKILINYVTVKLNKKENKIVQKNNKFVFFDFETTGFNGYVCQIGMVIVENDEIVAKINKLINPLRPITLEAMWQHRISDEMVENETTFAQFWPQISQYFNGEYLLIAHNIAFDIRVLMRELTRMDLALTTQIDFFCSRFGLAKYNSNEFKYTQKLDQIATKLNIKFTHHNAYADALAIYQIFASLESSVNKLISKAIDNGYNAWKLKLN